MCPECRVPMLILEYQGVEVDRCVQCQGTWLDSSEVWLIADKAKANAGLISDAILHARKGPKNHRRCPRCNRKLRLIHVGSHPEIELDRCPLGHGIWFDARELLTLITAFTLGEEGSVAAFFHELFPQHSPTPTEGA